MSRLAAEVEEDLATRAAVMAALSEPDPDVPNAAVLMPVVPLAEMIVQYLIPFRGVVTTLAGQVPQNEFNRSRDARFGNPIGVFLRYEVDPRNGQSSTVLYVTCSGNAAFRYIRLYGGKYNGWSGSIQTLAGREAERGGASGSATRDATFTAPMALCVDPTDANRMYLVDEVSVRVLDLATNQVTRLAGGSGDAGAGYVDGTGGDARFLRLVDVVCTCDGALLYVADAANSRLCAVDTKTGAVTTVKVKPAAGVELNGETEWDGAFEQPQSMAFDRGSDVPTDALLYVVCKNSIVQYDRRSGSANVLNLPTNEWSGEFSATGIASFANGLLLVSCSWPPALFAVDPRTTEMDHIAGSLLSPEYRNGASLLDAEFKLPVSIAIDERERCAVVADMLHHALRQVTLPPYLFSPHRPLRMRTE